MDQVLDDEALTVAETAGPVSAVIDKSLCGGHGRCYGIAPNVFDVGDDGDGVVVVDVVAPEDLEDARKAVRMCPEEAITLVAGEHP